MVGSGLGQPHGLHNAGAGDGQVGRRHASLGCCQPSPVREEKP